MKGKSPFSRIYCTYALAYFTTRSWVRSGGLRPLCARYASHAGSLAGAAWPRTAGPFAADARESAYSLECVQEAPLGEIQEMETIKKGLAPARPFLCRRRYFESFTISASWLFQPWRFMPMPRLAGRVTPCSWAICSMVFPESSSVFS